jgi:hypothetical protein
MGVINEKQPAAAASRPPKRDGELTGVDREIVNTLLDTKAVDFQALGQAIAAFGPRSVLMDDDGWIRFCGNDLRIFRWPRPRLGLEELVVLRELARDIPGGR